MVKKHDPPKSGETACSACGAAIKAPPSMRRRRVQCPKCREVVFLESFPEKEPETAAVATPVPEAMEEQHRRIELLEARVEVLEAALRDSMAASRTAAASGTAPRRMLWLTSEPGQAPDFSPERGRVLSHNLGSVRSQAITIRTPLGDPVARAHAEWFGSIFERAGWTVRGPEEIAPEAARVGLSLAVPELPVAREAAATYFALKAAGFEPTQVLDSALGRESGEGAAALSLTVSPEKAA